METAEELGRVILDAKWEWAKTSFSFRPGGLVTTFGNATRWEAVDRRTVLLIRRETDTRDRIAVLRFSEWVDRFDGFDFEGKPITSGNRITDKK